MHIHFNKIVTFLLLFIFIAGSVLIPAQKSLALTDEELKIKYPELEPIDSGGEGNGGFGGLSLPGPLGGANTSCLGIIPGVGEILNIFDVSGIISKVPVIGESLTEFTSKVPIPIPGIGGAGSHVPTFDVELNRTFPVYSAKQLGFKSREEQKERCLDKIAWQAAKFLIRQIVDDLANWLRGGAYGKPRFITDFDAYLRDAADNAGGILLEEILGRENAQLLCEPWRFQIVLDIFNPRNWRDDYGFKAKCKISDILRAAQGTSAGVSVNESAAIYNFYNDFSQGGWPAFLAMSLDDGSNPIGSYLMTLEEKDQRIAYETEKRKLEANVNKGLLLGACVNKGFSSITGREFCLRTEITSPGVAIEGAIKAAFGSEIRELELADEINELIAAAITGIKTRLLWRRGIAETRYRSGTSGFGWLSDAELRRRLATGAIPASDEKLIWRPVEISQLLMINETDKYILSAQNFLKIKSDSQALLEAASEEDIMPMINELLDLDPENTEIASLKTDAGKWLENIKNSIIYGNTLVYEKEKDPVADLLAKFPNWHKDTKQRTGLCDSTKDKDKFGDFSAAPYLPRLKIAIICNSDDAALTEIQNNHIDKLPELGIDEKAAKKERDNLQITKINLEKWLEIYNSNLGAPELVSPSDGNILRTKDESGNEVIEWKFETQWTQPGPLPEGGFNFQFIRVSDSFKTNFHSDGSEFILTQEEFDKLSAGEYFWRAAALDDAGKLGKYSEKWTFTKE